MLLFTSISAFVISILILYFNAKSFRSSVYLSLFFFLESLYLLTFYAVFYSGSAKLIAIFFLNFSFLLYLIGPALYVYIRSVLNDDHRLKWKDSIHLIPALIFLFTAFPFIFSGWTYKTEIAELIIEDIGTLKYLKPTVLYEIIPAPFLYLSRPVSALSYTVAALIVYTRWLNRGKKQAVYHQQKYLTIWIALLLLFFFLMVVSHTIPMILAYSEHNLKIFFTLILLQNLSGIGLTGLLISVLFFPRILYGLPHIPINFRRTELVDKQINPAEGDHGNKYKTKFEEDYLVHIGKMASQYMLENRCYLQQDCNLASFAKMLKVPMHHLAYYFREERKQTFNDYRNEWRIIHAKKLIEEGRAREMTLEAIGLLSGFSTRKTFIASFKKFEGISPGIYSVQITR